MSFLKVKVRLRIILGETWDNPHRESREKRGIILNRKNTYSITNNLVFCGVYVVYSTVIAGRTMW